MINIDPAEAKKGFKEWVKDFLAHRVGIPADDI